MSITRPIWQVTSSRGWGGRESLPVTLHQAFRASGIEARLCCAEDSPLAQRYAREAGIALLPFRGRGDIRTYRLLARRAKNDTPAAVICHFSADLALLRMALRRHDTRLILVKHVGPGNPKHDLIHRWIYRRVAVVLGVSNYIAERCRQAYPIAPEKVRVWHPGIDPEVFAPRPNTRENQRLVLGITPKETLIVCVARLTPGKGHSTLLAAFAALTAECPSVRLALVGGASKEEESFAAKLRAEARGSVIWSGQVEDIAGWLSAADIFVNPSPREAFGLNTIEAMGVGLPVVGTTGGGTPDIITDGKNGILVPPDEPSSLTLALHRLISDPALRERLGHHARRTVERFFTLSQAAERLLCHCV